MTTMESVDAVRPASLAEARDALLDEGRGRRLLIRGAGTKQGWGAAPRNVQLVVDTTGLDALVAHDAGDLTATVGAGMPVDRLQRELATAGQWLAIDPPHQRDGATVGGVYAANDSGPRRHRYGSMRDLVIGVTVVLADGAVARSGGHVIKNVAGYDLGKLFCGSLGTLGLAAELVLRLHPLPAGSATVRLACSAREATAFLTELGGSTIETSAVDWAGPDPAGGGHLWVRVEGSEAGVAAQSAAVGERAERHGLEAAGLAGDAEAAAWDALAAAVTGDEGETVARAGTLPDRLPAVARALADAAATAGVDAALHSHAGLGLHTARLSGGDPAAHADAVAGWRDRVRRLGGHVTVRRRRDGVDVAAWDPVPADDGAVALMRRIKQEFDPDGRCGPGRMIGGI